MTDPAVQAVAGSCQPHQCMGVVTFGLLLPTSESD